MSRNLQSHSFTRKRRKKFYWTLALVILIIASWLSALSFLTRLSAFAIDDVKVFGADADITPALQRAAEQTLNGSYLGLFHRYSTLIYPKSGIIAAVKAASPRVLNVNVNRAGLHGIVITVSQKVPAAIVCATLPDFDGNRLVFDQDSGCYDVDASGLIFQSAHSFDGDGTSSSSGVYSLPYNVYYAPDLVNNIGSYATSTDEFSALQSFMAGAISAGIPVQAILMKDDGEYELYASTTVIYFNDVAGISHELLNLTVFWPHMHSTFDYVDLRYGDNVVYKMIK